MWKTRKELFTYFDFFFFHTYKLTGKQTGPEKGNAMQ